MKLFWICLALFGLWLVPAVWQRQMPVLCYHNIKSNPGKEDLLTISQERFNSQMKHLFESGYHTISPDEIYNHFTLGTDLPSKPILITFDDSHLEHYEIAKSILENYGFRGVFFIVTVCINKPGYMTATQTKQLSDDGHTIAAHTWDHPVITTLKGETWERQIDKPKQQLEKITGKPVQSFAYPYGVWNETTAAELKKRGFKTAFQLTDKQSLNEPLLSIRRITVSGRWSLPELDKQIANTFHTN